MAHVQLPRLVINSTILKSVPHIFCQRPFPSYASDVTSTLTIGKLAQAACVPASTIRYYERVGLLSPAERTRGNYRVFHHDSLERVRFIRAAQKHGFSLDDIRKLVELRDDPSHACQEVQELILSRLTGIAGQARELKRIESELHSLLAICKASESQGSCAVISDIDRESTPVS